jgi:hypothetical protein
LQVVAMFTISITGSTLAQSTNRQIGTPFEVAGDPLVPRPHEQSCVVPYPDF